MSQYSSLNENLSNSQLNKLNAAIKNGTDVLFRLSSNMIGNSNNETNFPHKLLLTNRQILSLRKIFANHTSVDINAKRRVFKIFNAIVKIRIVFIKICS